MVKNLKQYISLFLATLLMSLQFASTMQAAPDDIRFDFDTGTEGASLKGSTFEYINVAAGKLVAGNNKAKNLSNQQAHIALPAVDFGDGGYYMHVNAKYKLSENVIFGSHFADIFNTAKDEYGTVYGTGYGQWNEFKTLTYDISAVTGVKYPRWIISFGSGSNGTASIEIESIVFSKSSKPPKSTNEVEMQYTEMYDNSESKAVRLLVSLGIMDYDRETQMFWDDTPMKRVQMAEVLCNLFNVKPEKNQVRMFDDVNEADRAVVETAVMKGYLSGYGEGKFGPDDYITGNQLIKIFVALLGGSNVADRMGGFPEGYFKAGELLGIDNISNLKSAQKVTRLDVANAVYDAMHSKYFDIDGIISDDIIYGLSKEDTLATKLGIYRTDGIMTADNVTSVTEPGGQGGQDVLINGVTMSDPNMITTGYLGYNVIVYERKNDKALTGEVIYIEEKRNNVLKLDAADVVLEDVEDRTVTYSFEDKTKKITLANAVDMIYNGVAERFSLTKLTAKTNDEITFIDNDNDNKYDVVVIYDYNDYMTNVVRSEDKEIKLQYNEPTLKLEDEIVRVYKDDIPVSFDEIENNQIISVAKSDNSSGDIVYTIKLGTESVSGMVSSVRTNQSGLLIVEIEGKTYYLSDYVQKLTSNNRLDELKVGYEATFYMNAFGFISVYKLDENKETVACLLTGRFIDDELEEKLLVKLYTQDGKIVELTSGEKIKIDGKKKEVSKFAQDTSVVDKLNRKQLVKYKSLGNTLVELTFAKENYSLVEFSRDVPYKNLRCNRTSVLAEQVNGEYLAERYKTIPSTIAFKIPVKTGLTDNSFYEDESLYRVLSGSFMWRGAVGSMELYDVMEDGSVSYAIWTYSPYENRLSTDEAVAVVKNIGQTVNKDEEVVGVIRVYDEAGAEKNLKLRSDCVLWGSNSIDNIKNGDIINYFTDSNGDIFQIKVICDERTSNQVKGVADTSQSYYTLFVLGRVAFMSNNQASIYTSQMRPENPTQTDAIISNTGNAVYLCEGNRVFPIEFDEIEPGDKVFALLNNSNSTRMLVVYR